MSIIDLELRQYVPCPPELFHLIRLAQRDPRISIHRRKWAANADVVLAEMVNETANGPVGAQHDKVCGRRDRLQFTGRSLTEKFITIGSIALLGLLVTGSVVQRSKRSSHHQNVQTVFQTVLSHLPCSLDRSDSISTSHAGQSVDLGKSAGNNNAVIADRPLDKRNIIWISAHEIVISLIHQHICVFWQLADEIFQVGAGSQISCGIVGIADVDETRVWSRSFQHGAQVVSKIGRKRDFDYI